MKLTVIVDNNPGRARGSWGWSIHVDCGSWNCLFDADSSPELMEENSRVLGIDLSKINFAVLSHNHWDHTGGFSYVARVAPGKPVYTPRDAESYFRSLGLKPVVVEESVRVASNAMVVGPVKAGFAGTSEIALAVDAGGKLVVIVGCSHPGVDLMCKRALEDMGFDKAYLVIGGFHSPSRRELDNLALIAEKIAPSHCSGDAAREYVRSRYPSKYVDVKSGDEIIV